MTSLKVAARYERRASVQPEEFLTVSEDLMKFHTGTLQKWVKQAPRVLDKSVKDSGDIGPDWVWQDHLAKYWKDLEGFESELQGFSDSIDDLHLRIPYLDREGNLAARAASIPRAAGIESVLGSFQFKTRADGREHIAYTVASVQGWIANFEKWSAESVRNLRAGLTSARKKIKYHKDRTL